MEASEFAFFHRLRVRWAEVDSQNIVFNGNYLLYFDVAVTEYWRAIGISYPVGYVDRFSQDFYAVKATVEFHSPLTFDDEVDIGCRVRQIGRSSLAFALGIWKGELHTTSGELVYVNTCLHDHKPNPWPEELIQAISAYEKLVPEPKASRN